MSEGNWLNKLKEIILVKNGELALKGLNRRNFEDTLAKNIQKAAASCGGVNVWRAQSTMYVTPLEGTDIEDAVACISRVFGIAALSRAAEVEKNMDVILPSVCAYLKDDLENAHTFKVNAKRADGVLPASALDLERGVAPFGHALRAFATARTPCAPSQPLKNVT